LLLTATATVVALGCTRTVIREGAYPPVRVPTANTSVRYNNVALTDGSLQGKIAVEGSDWHRTDTGNAEVWVQLRNRTDYYMQVEARVQFYDDSRAPIGAPSAWQRIGLSPNAIDTYREMSTSPDVVYYFIEVREGR
jgi:hypothetical protein